MMKVIRLMNKEVPLVLETCTSCHKTFPAKDMFTFWHGFGGVRVCSPCWDKLEERESNK